MKEWYFSYENTQTGPFDLDYAQTFVREHPGAYCWREGWSDWRFVFDVPEIRRMKKDGVTPFPPPPAAMLSPKPHSLPRAQVATTAFAAPDSSGSRAVSSEQASSGFGSDSYTEGLDYKIYGAEMQFVEIELDPNESAIAEAGAMMYKTADVKMETVFGDPNRQGGGLISALLGAGRRLLTNENMFVTVFTQSKMGKGKVAFAAPFPGTILALNLSDYRNKLICQKDSFLATAKGVQMGIQFQRRILTGLFGGEGFIMQKLEGNGWVFIHMGGTAHKVELGVGEKIHVDTGCLAAMTSTVDFDIEQAGGIKTMLFGGEGLFFAKLTGPGTVWLQSLPFSRLAGRMLASAPTVRHHSSVSEESSIMGSFFD